MSTKELGPKWPETGPDATGATESYGESGVGRTITIIESRQLYRECLALAIQSSTGGHVDCHSSLEAWRCEKGEGTASLMVLSVVGIPDEDVLTSLESLAPLAARMPIMLVSDKEEPDLIVAFLERNIRGFISTNLSISVMLRAIDLVSAGGVFVPASCLIRAQRRPANPASPAGHGVFTARQAVVVEALRRGKANKIIAYELNMRESTVKVHVRNIMRKLKATNRTEVAYLANQLLTGVDLKGFNSR